MLSIKKLPIIDEEFLLNELINLINYREIMLANKDSSDIEPKLLKRSSYRNAGKASFSNFLTRLSLHG